MEKNAINEIVLFMDSRGWQAWFKGPHAIPLKELFGTDILPLPYTTFASEEQVIRALSRLHPTIPITKKS